MPKAIRTALAEMDLRSIFRYIAMDNERAAAKLLRTIDAKINSCARMPGTGKPCDDYRPGLRSVPVGNYLIFYEPTADGIVVVRVLHGARDIQRLFDEMNG